MDSANRGAAPRLSRKRSRGASDAVASSPAAASSPMPASPPAFGIAHGRDDDDDIEEDAEVQDDIIRVHRPLPLPSPGV